MLAFACALITAFTAPPGTHMRLSRVAITMVSDEAPPAPAFKRETQQILSAQYEKDYAAMGAIGAYMTIREDMTRAWNTVAGADNRLDQGGLATLLSILGEDEGKAASMFSDAEAINLNKSGRIAYEEWCKVRDARARDASVSARRLIRPPCVRGSAGLPRFVQASAGREEILWPLLKSTRESVRGSSSSQSSGSGLAVSSPVPAGISDRTTLASCRVTCRRQRFCLRDHSLKDVNSVFTELRHNSDSVGARRVLYKYFLLSPPCPSL